MSISEKQEETPVNTFFSPEFAKNPYPIYHMLRSTQPLFKAPFGVWIATRYEDTAFILRDRRFGKNFENRLRAQHGDDVFEKYPVYEFMRHWMLMRNPPEHTRLRGLVAKAFAPRELNALRPRIQGLVDDLLDKVQDKGKMEFIQDFAYPLPVNVICDMLGLPEADRGQFYEGSRIGGRLIDPTPMSDEEMEDIRKGNEQQQAYFEAQIELRRKTPLDDLLTVMVQAEEDGERLSKAELISNTMLLFGAGHETTVNMLGNGLLAILSTPGQWEKLKADPSLVPTAVEEILRFDSSVQLTTRTALEDMEVNGVLIPEGETVMCMLGAANRDPDQYTDPDKFDVSREQIKPMSFGGGIHSCLGAPLARMEGQIALTNLIERLPNLRLDFEGEAEFKPTITLRGLVELPLAW